MTQQPPQNSEEADLYPLIEAAARDIHNSGEGWMGEIESFIELSKGDLKLVIDDLKRVANFLDAVITGYPITYPLSEVMAKLKLDEQTLRQLLKDVGSEIETSTSDPQEAITQKDLIALLADRAGSREGELLAEFLRGGSPPVVWG